MNNCNRPCELPVHTMEESIINYIGLHLHSYSEICTFLIACYHEFYIDKILLRVACHAHVNRPLSLAAILEHRTGTGNARQYEGAQLKLQSDISTPEVLQVPAPVLLL